MRICIDVDGVVCYTKLEGQSYAFVQPKPDAIKSIQTLKKAGHYIILYTSRHMKTCNHNVGQVIATQGKTLLEWLDKWGIPYDEVIFGKPLADVYIDDKAMKYEDNWPQIMQQLGDMKHETISI